MANDYDNLPTGIKLLKLLGRLLPPLATWYVTDSIWYALAVFLIGLIVGNFIATQHTQYAFKAVRRDPLGRFSQEDIDRASRQSLPVFLWAPPICGAIAAAAFIWLS